MSTSREPSQSVIDCMHLCCDQRTEPHREHSRKPVDCAFCADETDGVCPDYPATCRGCVDCRTGNGHDGPCICDCETKGSTHFFADRESQAIHDRSCDTCGKGSRPCGDTMGWAGYTNVCDLPAGHDGEHQMEQEGGVPVRWYPTPRGSRGDVHE